MRLPSRWIVGGALAGLLTLFGLWLAQELASAEDEAFAQKTQASMEARALADELAKGATDRLIELLREEDERPYFHYQNLYRDPRTRGDQPGVSPSPLAEGSLDPIVAVHFQLDEDGTVSLPSVNEEFPELTRKKGRMRNLELLAHLRDASARMQEEQLLVGVRDEELEGALITSTAQQQQIPRDVFVQNDAPNAVFRNPEAEEFRAKGDVSITTHPLRFTTITLGGRERLVALRRVDTPDGSRRQGFVVDHDALVAAGVSPADRPRVQVSAVNAAQPGSAASTIGPAAPWTVLVEETSKTGASAASLKREAWIRGAAVAALAGLFLSSILLVLRRAERLADERSRFAASAAHKLRTPLASLQLYGDMLADDLGDPSQSKRYARHISEQAERLGRVVANVLEFSRLERRNHRVSAVSGNLDEVAQRVVERMGATLQSAGLVVTYESSPCPAHFDADAIERVLTNLLDNAEKYTRNCSERRARVIVRSSPLPQLIVEDTGPGIPERHRLRAMEAFCRLEAPEDGPSGLGLGLALCRTLAERMGGRLSLTQSPLGGLRVELTLPD